MRAAIDTAVWVYGLIVPTSPAGSVVDAVRDGRVIPVVSWSLAGEITLVLRHPRLKRYAIDEARVADVVGLLRPHLPHVEPPPVPQPACGPPVVSAALRGGSALLVTDDEALLGDTGLRASLRERGADLLTPRQLLGRLEDASPRSPFLNPDGTLSAAYYRGWLGD